MNTVLRIGRFPATTSYPFRGLEGSALARGLLWLWGTVFGRVPGAAAFRCIDRGRGRPAHPRSECWFECLRRETERLEAQAPPDCYISPTILRGPSDVLAAMRGMEGFFLDLCENAGAVATAAARVNQLLMKSLDHITRLFNPSWGALHTFSGTGRPGRTIVIQEDAMGMCSPAMYRDIFMQCNAKVVEHFGKYVMFTLHSTGCKHYKHVLSTPGIAGLQSGDREHRSESAGSRAGIQRNSGEVSPIANGLLGVRAVAGSPAQAAHRRPVSDDP